jgi:hypothetical protein
MADSETGAGTPSTAVGISRRVVVGSLAGAAAWGQEKTRVKIFNVDDRL